MAEGRERAGWPCWWVPETRLAQQWRGEFAAGGYTVCIARRDAEKSRSVVQQIIASGGIAHAVSTDVAQ